MADPLQNPQAPSGFDVEGARNAGASDEDIAQHLATTRGFDYAGATKAGATPQDIIEHLRVRPAIPQVVKQGNLNVLEGTKPPAAPEPATSYITPGIFGGTHYNSEGVPIDANTGKPVDRKGFGSKGGGTLKGTINDLFGPGNLPMHEGRYAENKDPMMQVLRPTVGEVAGGAADIAHGEVQQGAHRMITGAGTATLPLLPAAFGGAPVKTALTLAAAYAGGKAARFGASKLTNNPNTQDLTEDVGNIVAGGLTARKLFKMTAGPSDQEKAFNALYPKNASSNEPSILPEVRNAAAQEAAANPANPIATKFGARPKLNVPKGKAGVRVATDVTQKAIDAHEAATQPVRQQFAGEQMTTTAGDAARAHITPEMRVAVANGDKSAIGQIADIEQAAQRAEGANTVGLADDLRHSWNDELHGDYSKSPAAQDVAPAVTQAKRSALNQLRGDFYNRLGELSGQDLSPVAKREGLLLEGKEGLRKSGNAALERGPQNDKTFMGRVLTGSDRDAGGVSSVAPAKASLLELPVNVLRALGDENFGTPVGDYVNRVRRSLADLPRVPKDVVPPPFPGGRLPVQQSLPTVGGPLFDITAPTSGPRVPFNPEDPTMATQLPPAQSPPSAAGTAEHVPGVNQAPADVLAGSQGQKVPRQLANPPVKGQLPAQAGGAISLPEASHSTLTEGRQFETPAGNEEVLPPLIRSFIENEERQGKFQGKKVPPVSGGSTFPIENKGWTDQGVLNKKDALEFKRYWEARGHSVQLNATGRAGQYYASLKLNPPVSGNAEGPSSLPNSPLNSPAEAMQFMKQAALKVFGKPYESLSVGEKLQLGSEAAKLQNAARQTLPEPVAQAIEAGRGTFMRDPRTGEQLLERTQEISQTPPFQKKKVDSSPTAQIVQLHKENGGSTFNLKEGNLMGKDMYAVSPHPEKTVTLDHPPTEKDINDFISKNRGLLAHPDRSVGTWNDGKGHHVLDVVATVKDEATAQELGREHNQQAIFHLGGKGEIPVKPASLPPATSFPGQSAPSGWLMKDGSLVPGDHRTTAQDYLRGNGGTKFDPTKPGDFLYSDPIKDFSEQTGAVRAMRELKGARSAAVYAEINSKPTPEQINSIVRMKGTGKLGFEIHQNGKTVAFKGDATPQELRAAVEKVFPESDVPEPIQKAISAKAGSR